MSDPVKIIVGEGESARVEIPSYGIIAGKEGPKGDRGEDGKSAYQVAVDNGFAGTEEAWLASLVGPQGEAGVDGTVSFEDLTPEQRESLRGPAGQKGDKGDTGATGPTGPAGPGLPTGGAVGQIPVKKSASNYDTEWQYPQYSRPNLLDNWYFVGGGSQLGDGVFPINQKGNAITTGYNVYPIDRWRMAGYTSTQCELLATGLKLTNTVSSGASGLRQYLPSTIPAGTKLTISVLGVGGETFTNLGARFYDSDNNYDSLTTSQMVRDGELIYGSIELTRDCVSCYFRMLPNVTDFTFKAVKLELGSYQTLAHQENGNWVLNELPNWFEELRKCQRVLQWIPSPWPGNYAPICSGICWDATTARMALQLPVPMISTPSVTLENTIAKLYLTGSASALDVSSIVAQSSSYSNANLRNVLCLICTTEGGSNRTQAILAITGTGNPGGILLSCEK